MLPFDDRDGWIWIDGAYVPWREAKVHVCTHGLHYASLVFEGERAYGGRIFKSRAHGERLQRSAELLQMETPYGVDAIEEVKAEVLRRNGLSDAYVRAFFWRGPEVMGASGRGGKIHAAVAAWDWPSYFDPEKRRQGIRLEVARWRRPAPESSPTAAKAAGLYLICTLAKQEAENRGFDDALMLDYRGLVAEATVANVFFVRDGALHTPVPDCFLDGITRQSVIELAQAAGMSVHVRPIRPDELSGFSECFLTGTASEITPVGSIGEARFVPGAVTERLSAAYAQAVRA